MDRILSGTGVPLIFLLLMNSLNTHTAPSGGSDCFRMYPHKTLATDREKTLLSITVEQCQERCLHETDFLCLSFDYLPEDTVCILSPESSYTAPHMLKTNQKVDHYERMLDCNHYHMLSSDVPHKADSALSPQQQIHKQFADVHATGGSTGNGMGYLGVGVPQSEATVTSESEGNETSVTDTANDTVSGSAMNGSQILLVVALQKHHEQGRMRDKHQRAEHEDLDHHDRHHERQEVHMHRTSDRSRHGGYDRSIEELPEIRSSILQRFIQAHYHKTDHQHSTVDREGQHRLRQSPNEEQMRQLHEDEEERAIQPDLDLHNRHADLRSRHTESHADEYPTSRTKQMSGPHNEHDKDTNNLKFERRSETSESRHAEKDHNLMFEQQKQYHQDILPDVERPDKHNHLQHDDTKGKRKHVREDYREAHDTHSTDSVEEVPDKAVLKHSSRSGKQQHDDSGHHTMDAHADKIQNKHETLKLKESKHAFNEDHLNVAQKEDIQRILHEEAFHSKHHKTDQGQRRHALNEANLKKAHEEELQRVKDEERHHGTHRSHRAPNEASLKAAHEEELQRVKDDESQHGAHRSHRAPNEASLKEAHEEELQRVKDDERQHDKHRKHKHQNEANLKAVHEEEVQRVKDDEIHHSKHRKHRPQSEDHWKTAHDEELQRVKVDDRHQSKHRKHKSEASLETAHEEELQRVKDDERHHSKHRSHRPQDEDHWKLAQQEERLRVAHDEKHHDKSYGTKDSKKKHDLNEAHLKLAHEEDIMRVSHEERSHKAHGKDHKHKDHFKDAQDEELLRISHEEKHHMRKEGTGARTKLPKSKTESHISAHTDEGKRIKKKEKHTHCTPDKSTKHDLNEKHLTSAKEEEVMRIKHDEKHHTEQKHENVHKSTTKSKPMISEEHLKKAHSEEVLRVKHDERGDHKHERRDIPDRHLERANREELMRIQSEERYHSRTQRMDRGRKAHVPFNEQHLELANQEELARIQHDEQQHARRSQHHDTSTREGRDRLHFASHDDHKAERNLRHGQGLRQEHLDLAHREELERMRIDEASLTEEERRLREEAMEEESGSGSGTEPIGSGDEGDQDEGSGSGNWHWGPREVFVEDDTLTRAERTKQLVDDSNVWDTHAD